MKMKRRVTLAVLIVLWLLLLAASIEVYYFQPQWRVFGLVISWFGGIVSGPLLMALYREFRP